MKKLEDYLKYEQPTKYIVESENYSDNFQTPVLTAGKSFILGYTDEEKNIFPDKDLPVIIFDDFTTECKYVDFPFKVKSSAMKILHPINNANLKFLYYYMKQLKFDNTLHKRYWISQYSQLEIPDLDSKSQKDFADKMEYIEKMLDIKKKQIDNCNNLIKSQFVEMFGDPLTSNNYGRIELRELTNVRQGLQIPISKRKLEPGDNRYKYITIQYLHGGKNVEYIENPSERVICKKDDLLMTRTGNTGQVVTNVDGVFHNNFFLVDFDRTKINKQFFIKYFENDGIYKDMLKRATTSTIPDLSHGEFYKMTIDLPPIELQNKFATIVEQIDKQKFVYPFYI